MGASDQRLLSAVAAASMFLAAACGGDDDGGNQPPASDINKCTEGRWVSHGGTAANQRNGCNVTAISPETVDGLTEKWRITPGSVVGTPAVYDGVVYFGSMDKQLHAVNADDGEEIWATPLEGGVQSSVLVTESSVYLVDLGAPGRSGATSRPPQFYRFDRANGEIVEQVDYDSHGLSVGWSSPVYIEDANLVVIGVASFEVFTPGTRSFHGKLIALDANTLAVKWKFDVNAPEYGPGVSVWSSPAVDSGLKLVYIGTGQGYEDPVTPLSDSLIAVNYETGALAWKQQYNQDDKYVLGGTDNGPDYDVGAPPNLFDLPDGTPAVAVGDKEGTFRVHDRRNGDLIWKNKITAGSSLGGVMQSAAVYDDEIFVISNKVSGSSPSLFALDATDGTEIWNVDLGEISIFGAVTVVNGVIFFGDMNGTVQVRSAADGSILWADPHVPSTGSAGAAEAIAAGISVVNDTIYVPFGGEAFPITYFLQRSPAVLGGGVVAYHVAP